MANPLSYIYVTLGDIVAPLRKSLSSLEELEELFYRYGWDVPLEEEVYNRINQATTIKESFEGFFQRVEVILEKRSNNQEIKLEDFTELASKAEPIIQFISNFEIEEFTGLPEPLGEKDFWQDIVGHLFDDLIITYLSYYQPTAFAVLHVLGIIRYDTLAPQEPFRTKYIRKVFDWSQASAVLSDPLESFKSYYHWGNGDQPFDHERLLASLKRALRAVLLPAKIAIPDNDNIHTPSIDYIIEHNVNELRLPFAYGMSLMDYSIIEIGLSTLPIPSEPSKPPNGLLIRPILRGSTGQKIDLNSSLELTFDGAIKADNIFGVKLYPDNTELVTGITDTDIEAKLSLKASPTLPWILIGSKDSHRLELYGFELDFTVSGKVSDPEVKIALTTTSSDEDSKGVKVVIPMNDSDSFLQEKVSKKPLVAEFDIGLEWSNKTGFQFNGNLDISFERDLNLKLGPIQLRNLAFRLGEGKQVTSHKNISLTTGLGVFGEFGPVQFLVEGMGFSMDFIPYSHEDLRNLPPEADRPLLGLLDLDFGFKPPTKVGINVDAKVITGGGFIEFDPDNHRYSGILALSLKALEIELIAIGLITTRLPNNEKGFSMLISVSVIFSPSIQLVFGFTLNGVGGLVGINRTMKVDVLREKIKSGAIESFMFPKDVIKNAPKIISDLRAVFPPQKKHYVFAPLLKFGWGTPSIVEIDLGVLVELPFKGRLILIGSVGLYFPQKDIEKKLAEIHIDIFGDFNFAESYVQIEGRLRDSQIVGIALSGGFAFVLVWGDQPQFLMSIGGYHPRYKKPERFPEIPRLTALIKKGSTFSLTCQLYQAVTSNSFQLGLQADLQLKSSGVGVKGFLAFNAFLQFDPFLFETDIHIIVAVSYKGKNLAGIELYFLLNGPEPWNANGYAQISILFYTLKVKFNVTWGGQQEIVEALVKVLDLLTKLQDQLSDDRNWAGKLPANFNAAESLRSSDESESNGKILVHPIGHLELRQTVVPLNQTIEKLGNSYVEDKPVFRIKNYDLGDGEKDVPKEKTLYEHFSRGQYKDLSDAEKISTPDFDLMAAGVSLGSDSEYDFSKELEFTASDFEDIILYGEETVTETGHAESRQQSSFAGGSGRSMKEEKPAQIFGVIEDLPDFEDRHYKIVSREDLQQKDEVFMTYTAAEDHLKTELVDEKEKWQIVEEE